MARRGRMGDELREAAAEVVRRIDGPGPGAHETVAAVRRLRTLLAEEPEGGVVGVYASDALAIKGKVVGG